MIPSLLRGVFTGASRPVLWLGAGASRQADPPLPTLAELAERLIAREGATWEDPPGGQDPYTIIDAFLADVGTQGDLQVFLDEQCRPGGRRSRPGLLHRALARMIAGGSFRGVVDTNYDLVLRAACDEVGGAYDFAVLDRNLHLPDSPRPRYLALHGSMDDWSSVVLSGHSYETYAGRYPLAVAELETLLRQNRVLVVGSSLEDPRLLEWFSGLDPAACRTLHRWVALVGPGTASRLARLRWRDGRTYARVLEHIRLVELGSYDDLPRWFEELAADVTLPGRRELAVAIRPGETTWEVEVGGRSVTVDAPDLDRDRLAVFRALACCAVPCDRDGVLDDRARPALAAMEGEARRIGQRLGAALGGAMPALRHLLGAAATEGPAMLRLQVSGPDNMVDQVMLLPWEVIAVDGRLPVRDGALSVVREVVVAGAGGLPEAVASPRIVAHVSAPQVAGVQDLFLEEASYRMARALDPLRQNVRFTEMGTLDDLTTAVADIGGPVTLLHFSGHGGPGHLVFEDDEGDALEVPIETFTQELRQVDDRLPAAVWLSCCYSGGGDVLLDAVPNVEAGEAGVPIVAAALHRAGVPQILGYFGPVADPLAARVDRDMFTHLVGTGRAVEAARRARLGSLAPIWTSGGWLRFPLAWSTLTLYHRGDDRPLFSRLSDQSRAPLEEGLARRRLELSGAQGLQALEHGFIGRRRLLAELRSVRRARRALGVYGLGGLGKTALMIRYSLVLAGAHRALRDVIALAIGQYDTATGGTDPFVWVRSLVHSVLADHPRRPDALDEWIEQVAEDADAPAALARLVLEVGKGGVVYLDNVESLQDLTRSAEPEVPWTDDRVARFFLVLTTEVPADTTVLMTSRYRPPRAGWWQEITSCSSDEIFRMTAWLDPFGRLPVELREELTDRIDGHPRTVEFLNGLLHDAEEHSRHLVGVGDEVATVREKVVEPALEGLGEKLEQDLVLDRLIDVLDEAEGALLGECMAVQRPVPREVVDQLGRGADRLIALGLLTRFTGSVVWALHPLVRDAVSRRPEPPSSTREGRQVLARYWTARASETGTALDWRSALDHALSAEDWEAAEHALVTLSDGFRARGLVRVRAELLDSLENIPWPDAQRDTWLYHTGDAAHDMGLYARAAELMRQSVTLAQQIQGTPEHPDVAASLSGWANALVRLGEYREAVARYEESVAIQVRVYGGREHPEVAASLHGWANALVHLGEYRAAVARYEESVAIQVRVFGGREHPEVAASLHGWANALVELGDLKGAETHLREVLRIEEAMFGSRRTSISLPTLLLLGALLLPERSGEALPVLDDAWQVAREQHLRAETIQAGRLLHAHATTDDGEPSLEEIQAGLRDAISGLRADDPVRRQVEDLLAGGGP